MKKFADISPKKLLAYLIIFDLFLVAFSVIVPEDPKAYFKEFQLITWISALKLLSIAYINRQIYQIQLNNKKSKFANLWFLISAGFIFLFLDEVLLIHENIDKTIHILLGINETGLSDRIDDLIVIIYAVIGVFILRHYKYEILRFRESIPYLVLGFLFLILRTIIDTVTNRADIIPNIISDPESLVLVSNFLAVSEGAGKIIAESFFITAFYYCWKSAIKKKNSQ